MATLTVQLSQETTARLDREARRRGMDIPTYVRVLLGDKDPAESQLRNPDTDRAIVRQPATRDDDLSLPGSPEAMVATIRARGPLPVQEAKADLAELLRTGGMDPGMSPADWDRRWAAYAVRQKQLDLADAEKTRREMQELLANDDRSQ